MQIIGNWKSDHCWISCKRVNTQLLSFLLARILLSFQKVTIQLLREWKQKKQNLPKFHALRKLEKRENLMVEMSSIRSEKLESSDQHKLTSQKVTLNVFRKVTIHVILHKIYNVIANWCVWKIELFKMFFDRPFGRGKPSISAAYFWRPNYITAETP